MVPASGGYFFEMARGKLWLRAEVPRLTGSERGEVTVEYEPGQLELEKLIATVERACQVRITRPPAR